MDAVEKDSMRDLIMSGGPWSEQGKLDIFAYCESDVIALEKLLPKLVPYLSVPHSLLRGRYMKAAAQIEYNGIPIDTKSLALFKNNWDSIEKFVH